jgi:probable O-glycosylation ligase (exosortase A-associated)
MNPHRLTYGFAYDMPFAQIIAIVLFVSLVFSKEKLRLPKNWIVPIWVFFIIWMGITTTFAYFPDGAWVQYKKIIKIQVITFLVMLLINDMEKMRYLIWTIVLSIGFYSIKGGIYTILTAGGGRVWGPPGGFIEDNNALAVAILMIIPLMVFLYQTSDNGWIRKGMIVAIVLSLFTVLGSQSRGALIAILTVGLFYWKESGSKIASGFLIIIFAGVLLAFMPETWYKRMETIETYQEDSSAMGRLNAWEYSFNAANDNFTGVGLDAWSFDTFLIYAPNPADVHAAHSIYFSVLADHGWVGLLLFLLIFGGAWKALSNLIGETKDQENSKQIYLLAKMLKISLIAYFSGGAFLSLSYFDLPWNIVAIVILLNNYLKVQEKKDIHLEN